MAPELIWSPQAREDLIDIYMTIAAEHPRSADRYLDALEAKAGHLIDHPRMGSRRPDIAHSARMLVEAPFVLLYETEPDSDDGPVAQVTVVRVVDGRRDLPALMRS